MLYALVRSIALVLGLVARMTWRTFVVVSVCALFGMTLQFCALYVCHLSLYAFVYGWTEVAYRLVH